MGRWEGDAEGRLQHAAVTLFLERGYSEVTVAQIADRAGLTKRTFFNHFADKREVLFAGAPSFEASVVRHLAAIGDDLDPVEAAVAALTRGSQELSAYAPFARIRRDLIASAPELQERDLIKMASLASAIASQLRQRHLSAGTAALTAKAAVAVYSAAYNAWADDTTADLAGLMREALADLRQILGVTDQSVRAP